MHDLAVEGRRSVKRWNGPQDVNDEGLFVQIKREGQASIQFDGGCARFRVNPDPASSEYVASRISDIDTHLPVDRRVKRWQTTNGKTIAGRFRVRFLHEQTSITYNLMMWNAPFDREKLMSATSIGVTRSVASGFEYAIVIAQNVTVNPQASGYSGGILRIAKLKEVARWLDMTKWHWVHIELAENQACVSMYQGTKNTVIRQTMLQPIEALGFVLSVDNEVFPNRYIPVSKQEGFDLAFFEAGQR